MAVETMTPLTVRRLVDVSVVADALGVCQSTIRRLADRGAIPCARIGSAIRFDLADVLAAVKAPVAHGVNRAPVETDRLACRCQ